MNNKGFTLVELLATIVILGILFGITLVLVNGGFGNAKEKTENVFVKTLQDSLDIYVDTDAKRITEWSNVPYCTLAKTHGYVKVYMATEALTYNDVIGSSYSPMTMGDLHNPANKNKENYECNADGQLLIFRDEDFVYYYKIRKGSFECLNQDPDGYITNLPDDCVVVPN